MVFTVYSSGPDSNGKSAYLDIIRVFRFIYLWIIEVSIFYSSEKVYIFSSCFSGVCQVFIIYTINLQRC